MPPQEELEQVMRVLYAGLAMHALVLGSTNQGRDITGSDQFLAGRSRQIADALVVELRSVPLPPVSP